MAALTIEQGIGCSFADVPSVKGVYVLNRADVLNVFTIVDTDDEDAFDAIYDRARLVIGRFPDFHFDFNVIARRGRPIREFLSLGAPVWQRGDSELPCPAENSI